MTPSFGRRLNIGCGGQYRCGYVNLDNESNTVADVRADACLLPFSEEEFDRIEMIHILEHLGYIEALHALAEAYRVLCTGGDLIIETPDPEGSFELFLADPRQERRSQLLSWMFGLQTSGYQHRLLYPEALLRSMLERAGFLDIRAETPRTHRYAPGLRMVARRGEHPVHRVLAHLRRAICQSGIPDLSHQLQGLEFETVFVGNVLALGGRGELPSDPVAAALANILMAPEAAVTWLELCENHDVELPRDLEKLSSVARAAASEHLFLRMEALFEILLDQGTDAQDGYEYLCERGLAALREAFESESGLQRSVLQQGLPPYDRAESSLPRVFESESVLQPSMLDRGQLVSEIQSGGNQNRWASDQGAPATSSGGRPPLTRALLRSRVAALHDQAVRMLCHDRRQEALQLLQRAARARIDPFYPLWNLAVTHAAQGQLDQAVEYYRDALALAATITEPVLKGELAVCYLHARRPHQALALLCEPMQEDDRDASEKGASREEGGGVTSADGHDDWDALVHLARQMLASDEEPSPSELPALRTRPVLTGESLYHEPDSI